MARRDVDLVIRARDEAKGALESINQTLDRFVGKQRDTQDEAAKTDSQLDRLGDAISNLQKNLKGLTGAGAVEREIDRARAAMTRLETATDRTAGETLGYRREALQAARATGELRGESERLEAAIKGQEAAVNRSKAAQRALGNETKRNTAAQRQYSTQQEKLGTQIAQQNLNLANYKNRFRELQIAISSVAQPTAALQREFDRTASNIQRTEEKIAGLADTQRLISAETERANRTLERSRDLYAGQAASLGRAEAALAGLRQEQSRTNAALKTAASAQGKLESGADKAAQALRGQEAALERARENYAGVEQASRETEGALAELEDRVRGPLLRAFGEQRARLKETEQGLRANSEEAQRLAKELRETEAPSRELVEAFEKQRTATARARQEIREQQRVLAELRAILRESGGDVDTFASRQNRFASALQRAQSSFAGYRGSADAAATANERLIRAQQRAQQSTGRLTAGTNNLSRATANAARNQGLFADAMRRSYGESRVALSFTQRLRGEVLSLVAAYGGFFAVIDLIRNTVNAFQALEAATNRLNVVFQGDDIAVNQELDFIRRNAERLGIEFGALAQEYTKFAVATQGTNLEGAETRRIFIAVAEAARVNNLTLDQLQGTFVALTQIVSKGSVSMEELRQQLGDRLPGAIQIMAAGLGVGTDELIRMIEQGQVSSDALSSFADELDRRFSDQLPEALQNTNAALGRFQNALFQTFLRIGEGGAIEGFVRLLEDLTATLDSAQFRDFADRVGSALGTLFDVLGALVRNFDLIIIAVTTFIGLKVAPFVVALVTVLTRLPAIIRLNQIRLASFRAGLAATTGSLTGTAAAVGRLRAAITLLLSSTGIGLLVALIGTGIGLWVTRTESATEALRQHENILDQVRNAYDETTGSVDEWRSRLENLTVTQARGNLVSLQVELRNLRQEFENAIPRNVLGGAVGAGGGFFREVDALFQQFDNGTIEGEEFLSLLDDLNERYRDLFPVNAQFAESFDEIARRIASASENTEDARDVIVALTGSGEDARAALERLAGNVEETGVAADSAAENLENYQEAIQELRGLVPGLADEIEDLERRAQLEEALQATLRYAQSWNQVLAAFSLFEQALQDSDLTSFLGDLSGVGGGASGIAAQVIRGFESFSAEAYYDVNAFRAGFGSDTITLADGSIRAITEGMTVSRADAERDLARRIATEFQPAVERAVGTERFQGLDQRQQAALVSLAYNYGAGAFQNGEALSGVASAVRGGSLEEVVAAIERLGARGLAGTEYEEGSRIRTAREAALFESGGVIDSSGYVAAAEAASEAAAREADERERAAEATEAMLLDNAFAIEQQELINAGREREAAIQAALREARGQNANITDAELAAIEEQTARLFDLQQQEEDRLTTSERALQAEERVNELLQLRTQLQSELDAAQTSGAGEEALTRIQDQMDEVNRRLQEAIQNALDFAIAMGSSDPAIQALISRLRELQLQGVESGNQIRITYEAVEGALSSSLVNAANKFAESLANGASVTESLRAAFLQFASDFLRQIAQMILQQLALNAAKAILGAFGFGASQAVVLHSGGVVGASGGARRVDASAFMGAVRYHGGGIAGLQPGEVPSVLKRGEEVLTQDDPRHIFNGGGAGGGASQGARIKIVNALDGGQVVSEGLNTSAGEEAILNFIRSNASSVRAAIET